MREFTLGFETSDSAPEENLKSLQLSAVRKSLVACGYSEICRLQVQLESGKIVLKGSVSSYRLKQLAWHASASVLDTTEFEFLVRVVPPGTMPAIRSGPDCEMTERHSVSD